MYGPSTIELWHASDLRARTGQIYADAMSLGVLDGYHPFINGLYRIFGEVCWLLLYQAETRCRLELAPRLLTKYKAEKVATTAGQPSSWT